MTQLENDGTGPRGRAVMLTLALIAGLASLGTSIANIALPSLAEAFEAPFSQVQGVVVAYLGALTLSVLLAGRLGDRIDLKRMLLIGLGLFITASLLCSSAPNLWFLIAARVIQGFGAAFMMTLPMALMRQMAGEVRLGRAMGLLGTVSAIGTALGPSLGGFLLPVLGWRASFGVLVPMASLSLVLALVLVPTEARRPATSAPRARPALNRPFIMGLVCNGLVAAVMMTTLVVGPFYLGLGLDLDPKMVGLVMTVGPAISIISGIPSGRLVDVLGSRSVLTIGSVLLAAGAFLLALLPDLAGGANYIAAMVVLTPGYQLFQAANNTAAMTDVPKERRGTVSGLLNLSRNVGLVCGAVIMGTIFAHGAGTQEFSQAAPAAIVAGTRLTFAIAGMMMVAVVGMSLAGRSDRMIRR